METLYARTKLTEPRLGRKGGARDVDSVVRSGPKEEASTISFDFLHPEPAYEFMADIGREHDAIMINKYDGAPNFFEDQPSRCDGESVCATK